MMLQKAAAMLDYRLSLSVRGSVTRQVIENEERDKEWQRCKSLDSLLAKRMQNLRVLPDYLIYASTDTQRPQLASMFSHCSLLNGFSDLFNALIKTPVQRTCFVQIVDRPPGLEDSARLALEKSLLRISPFPLDSFEELLEVQEQVYGTKIFSGVLLDRHGRLMPRDEKSFFRKRKNDEKASLFVEGVIEPSDGLPGAKVLEGRDYKVQDFRQGLLGVHELFQNWDDWLARGERVSRSHERVYLYSHLKGLLPAAWEELHKRGTSADKLRIPQWISHSNAIAAYLEFLVAEVESAAFMLIGMNGICHFAEWTR